MKNKIYLIIAFFSCVLAACDNKEEAFNGPYNITITGSASVVPTNVKVYQIGNVTNPEKYTWTVDGPAEIVGATTGNKVTVKYKSVGTVTIKVSTATESGSIVVTVNKPAPVPAVDFNHGGALKDGLSDTLFLTFPAPLQSVPTITLLSSTDSSEFHFTAKKKDRLAFSSGTLGDLVQLSAKSYYVIYTAGTGNGIPEAKIKGILTSTEFGAVKLDSTFIQLFKVDNIAPLAKMSYSKKLLKDGSTVLITATFSEEVTFATPLLDSALRVKIEAPGETVVDTLKPTDNPLVYTYKYQAANGGDGLIDVYPVNVMDLAGNVLDNVSNGLYLEVDNTSPNVDYEVGDDGDYAEIGFWSSETGTVNYLVLKASDDAPTTAAEYLSLAGELSGVESVKANQPIYLEKVVPTGSYVVYFLGKDEVGNYSTIVPASLTMN